MRKLSPGIYLLFLFFTACSKNQDPATGSVSIQLKAVTSFVQGSSVEWTRGSAALVATAIEARKEDNSEIVFNPATDTTVDLFTPVNAAVIILPAGKYPQLVFSSQLNRRKQAPALRLEGSYAAGGVVTPMVFEVYTPLEIRARKDTVTITGGAMYMAQTTIDLSLLTKGIADADLKAAEKQGGVMILSAGSNPGVYSKMLVNLPSCIGIDLH